MADARCRSSSCRPSASCSRARPPMVITAHARRRRHRLPARPRAVPRRAHRVDDARIHLDDGTVQHVAVHGGFVEVSNNKVSILSDVAELAEDIDVARAEEALARGRAPARPRRTTPTTEAELRRAQARLVGAPAGSSPRRVAQPSSSGPSRRRRDRGRRRRARATFAEALGVVEQQPVLGELDLVDGWNSSSRSTPVYSAECDRRGLLVVELDGLIEVVRVGDVAHVAIFAWSGGGAFQRMSLSMPPTSNAMTRTWSQVRHDDDAAEHAVRPGCRRR